MKPGRGTRRRASRQPRRWGREAWQSPRAPRSRTSAAQSLSCMTLTAARSAAGIGAAHAASPSPPPADRHRSSPTCLGAH
eukprot:scaffold3818_cov132-Isochrysis_galbana.AAC.2